MLAPMGYLDEDPANKHVLGIMYLSLGEVAKKQFRDKFPHATLWALKVDELIKLY